MITECYVKGRFDYGVGKCAVVIVEGGEIHDQTAWTVPASWEYAGVTVNADQFNCEILAAVFAVRWCKRHGKKAVNIYANTNTAQKWYYRKDFPDGRAMAKAFCDEADDTIDIYAEFMPKGNDNVYNRLVNELAESI